jgi:hypothetical protein
MSQNQNQSQSQNQSQNQNQTNEQKRYNNIINFLNQLIAQKILFNTSYQKVQELIEEAEGLIKAGSSYSDDDKRAFENIKLELGKLQQNSIKITLQQNSPQNQTQIQIGTAPKQYTKPLEGKTQYCTLTENNIKRSFVEHTERVSFENEKYNRTIITIPQGSCPAADKKEDMRLYASELMLHLIQNNDKRISEKQPIVINAISKEAELAANFYMAAKSFLLKAGFNEGDLPKLIKFNVDGKIEQEPEKKIATIKALVKDMKEFDKIIEPRATIYKLSKDIETNRNVP